jgi:hypothetical protein
MHRPSKGRLAELGVPILESYNYQDFNEQERKSDYVPQRTQVPTARLQKHGLIADIFMNRQTGGFIFHFIVQRDGAAEILFWGQEHSFKEALNRIQEFLDETCNPAASA